MTNYESSVNAFQHREQTTQDLMTSTSPYDMFETDMPLDRLASLSQQISILEEKMAQCKSWYLDVVTAKYFQIIQCSVPKLPGSKNGTYQIAIRRKFRKTLFDLSPFEEVWYNSVSCPVNEFPALSAGGGGTCLSVDRQVLDVWLSGRVECALDFCLDSSNPPHIYDAVVQVVWASL